MRKRSLTFCKRLESIHFSRPVLWMAWSGVRRVRQHRDKSIKTPANAAANRENRTLANGGGRAVPVESSLYPWPGAGDERNWNAARMSAVDTGRPYTNLR